MFVKPSRMVNWSEIEKWKGTFECCKEGAIGDVL